MASSDKSNKGSQKPSKKAKASPSKGQGETGAPTHEPLTLEQSIGHHIRQLRRRQELTGGSLAKAAQISTSMLSKIENGQISPSLQTLQALAAALSTPLTSFFASHEDRRECSFMKAGQANGIERRGSKSGHRYHLLGHSRSSELIVEPYYITLSQGATPHTGFRHDGLEIIYMLSGKVAYRHADTTYTMEPGDTLFFDATAAHGPEELLVLPMSYLSIIIYRRC